MRRAKYCDKRKINWEHIQKKYKWNASVINYDSSDDITGVLSLVNSYYKEADESHMDYFCWEYMNNPSGLATIYLARNGNNIIGQYVANPMKARIDGLLCTGCIIVKTLTRNDFRGKGVYPYLADKAIHACFNNGANFIYGFPNRSVYRTTLERLGFSHVATIPLLVKPINTNKTLGLIIHNKALIRAAGFFLSIVCAVADIFFEACFRMMQYGGKKPVIKEDQVFDARYDAFWQKVQSDYKNIIVRDSKFLNWRYLENPRRQYKVFSASDSKSNIIAYVVVRISRFNMMKVGYVVDILSEKTYAGYYASFLLIRKACSYFKQNAVDLIGCVVLPNSPYFRMFLKNGFCPCPPRFQPQPFVFHVRTARKKADNLALYEKRNWFLTLGDCDSI